MDKRKWLKIVNVILALSFLMAATGGVIRYFAPDAIPYEAFRLVHPIFGLCMVLSVIAHVSLNFGWIKSTYFKK